LYTNFSLQKRGREGGEERQREQQEEEERRREEQEEEEQAKTPATDRRDRGRQKDEGGERERERGKDQRREKFLALTTKSGTKEPSVLGNLRKMPTQRTVGSRRFKEKSESKNLPWFQLFKKPL
jgi:hypothetical protein